MNMFFSILKQWKTLNGEYYSTTVDKTNYDSAFGEIHSMVKPMMNDANVASFRLSLINENGNTLIPIVWNREIPTDEETTEQE